MARTKAQRRNNKFITYTKDFAGIKIPTSDNPMIIERYSKISDSRMRNDFGGNQKKVQKERRNVKKENYAWDHRNQGVEK